MLGSEFGIYKTLSATGCITIEATSAGKLINTVIHMELQLYHQNPLAINLTHVSMLKLPMTFEWLQPVRFWQWKNSKVSTHTWNLHT